MKQEEHTILKASAPMRMAFEKRRFSPYELDTIRKVRMREPADPIGFSFYHHTKVRIIASDRMGLNFFGSYFDSVEYDTIHTIRNPNQQHQ